MENLIYQNYMLREQVKELQQRLRGPEQQPKVKLDLQEKRLLDSTIISLEKEVNILREENAEQEERLRKRKEKLSSLKAGVSVATDSMEVALKEGGHEAGLSTNGTAMEHLLQVASILISVANSNDNATKSTKRTNRTLEKLIARLERHVDCEPESSGGTPSQILRNLEVLVTKLVGKLEQEEYKRRALHQYNCELKTLIHEIWKKESPAKVKGKSPEKRQRAEQTQVKPEPSPDQKATRSRREEPCDGYWELY